jgi:hypothetical protein
MDSTRNHGGLAQKPTFDSTSMEETKKAPVQLSKHSETSVLPAVRNKTTF